MYDNYDYNSTFPMSESLTSLFYAIFIYYVIKEVIVVASMWRIFQKADRPGWAAIVPAYNCMVLSDITFGTIWLGLIPVVSIIADKVLHLGLFASILAFVSVIYNIILSIKLANVFDKSVGFGMGLLFLPFVFYPMLAFGSSSYCGTFSLGDTFISGGRPKGGYSGDYYTRNYNSSQPTYNSDSFYSGNTYNGGQQNNAVNDQFYGQGNSGNVGYSYNQYGTVNNSDFYGQNNASQETNPFEQSNNYNQYGDVDNGDFYRQSNASSETRTYGQDNRFY